MEDQLIVVNKATLQMVIDYMLNNEDAIRSRFALERLVEQSPTVDPALLTEAQRDAVATADSSRSFV